MRGAPSILLLACTLLSMPAAVHAHCRDAVNARRAPAGDPSAELVEGVFERVNGAFSALTGRATELVVLDKTAVKADGSPFPASAFICPSQAAVETPKLYVTWPLIARAQADKLYDIDFMALVIGHELGHRARDLTFEGLRDTRQGGASIEARADAHGAFFAAVAGYSSRRLACDAALDTFLDVEAHVAAAARTERKRKLAEALAAFDVFENLYEASVGLAFWDSGQARTLLNWIDQRLGRDFTPIPEFKVLLALTILIDVAADAPWAKLVSVPGAPNSDLRCAPVFPQHTALWDEILAAAEAGTTRDSGADVKRTIRLLNDALGLGASPLATHSTLACAHAYLGDTKRASTSLAQAREAARGRPKALQRALAANEAFIAWIDWMVASKIPAAGDPVDVKKSWARSVRGARRSFVAHPQIASWIDRLARYPAAPPPPASAGVTCNQKPPRAIPGAGWSRLPTCPDAPRAGGCPCGWIELHHLGDPLTPQDPADGVRTCVPGGWGSGLRWVDVALPLPDIELRLMLVDHIDAGGSLSSLESWERHCQVLEVRGTSDRGRRVYAGICPELGAPQVVLHADDCRVERALVIAP